MCHEVMVVLLLLIQAVKKSCGYLCLLVDGIHAQQHQQNSSIFLDHLDLGLDSVCLHVVCMLCTNTPTATVHYHCSLTFPTVTVQCHCSLLLFPVQAFS